MTVLWNVIIRLILYVTVVNDCYYQQAGCAERIRRCLDCSGIDFEVFLPLQANAYTTYDVEKAQERRLQNILSIH